MPRETPWELCRRMAEDTLKRIREDRRTASVRVARLLDTLEEKLFDSDLQVEDLRRASGELDPNLSTRFAAELGVASVWTHSDLPKRRGRRKTRTLPRVSRSRTWAVRST